MSIRKRIGALFIACGLIGVGISVLFFLKPDTMLYLVGLQSPYADYRAVTMINKAMFIGKVTNESADPVVLTNVFYIKKATPSAILQKMGEGDTIKSEAIKIKRKDILYLQKLQPNSSILRLIQKYYDDKNKPKQNVEVPINP
ncbi:MAG: hypothetical protein AAB893_00340 [Patescibacteria group bacterium]